MNTVLCRCPLASSPVIYSAETWPCSQCTGWVFHKQHPELAVFELFLDKKKSVWGRVHRTQIYAWLYDWGFSKQFHVLFVSIMWQTPLCGLPHCSSVWFTSWMRRERGEPFMFITKLCAFCETDDTHKWIERSFIMWRYPFVWVFVCSEFTCSL